jgi:hypothetical protein
MTATSIVIPAKTRTTICHPVWCRNSIHGRYAASR